MNTSPRRVALVTGAGSGIGRAAAKALIGSGYCVVMTGRRLNALDDAIQQIGGNDSNCLAVTCDVG